MEAAPSGEEKPSAEVLVAVVQQFIDEELRAIESLRTRASGLAGLIGVIVSLTGVFLARNALGFAAPLSVRIIAVSLLFSALASLISAAWVLVRVLGPRREPERERFSGKDIADFTKLTVAQPDIVQHRNLEAFVALLETVRNTADSLGRELRRAMPLLVGGLILVAAVAMIAALFNANLV